MTDLSFANLLLLKSKYVFGFSWKAMAESMNEWNTYNVHVVKDFNIKDWNIHFHVIYLVPSQTLPIYIDIWYHVTLYICTYNGLYKY